MKIPDLKQPTRRSELLVSVRSLAEAEVAAAELIDILDFKEPHRGPLAPVDSSIWHEAASRFSSELDSTARFRLSAALGERDTARRVAGQVPETFAYAKAGPHRCGSAAELTELWSDVREHLAASVELVAVAYSDAKAAETLEPEEIVALAKDHGFHRILIDTFAKDGRSSVEHLQVDRLRDLRRATSESGMRLMLAGSIRLHQLDDWLLHDTQPDGFGIRGDVCESGRESNISRARIRMWSQRLSEFQIQ